MSEIAVVGSVAADVAIGEVVFSAALCGLLTDAEDDDGGGEQD